MEAIYILSTYLSGSDETQKAEAISAAKAWAADRSAPMNPTKQIVAGSILLGEGLFDDALKALHAPMSLEA